MKLKIWTLLKMIAQNRLGWQHKVETRYSKGVGTRRNIIVVIMKLSQSEYTGLWGC